jgi:hypothetical protein
MSVKTYEDVQAMSRKLTDIDTMYLYSGNDVKSKPVNWTWTEPSIIPAGTQRYDPFWSPGSCGAWEELYIMATSQFGFHILAHQRWCSQCCGMCTQGCTLRTKVNVYVQCSLDLLFFKGPTKMVDEYGETVNPENHFFKKKNLTLSFASWQNFTSI